MSPVTFAPLASPDGAVTTLLGALGGVFGQDHVVWAGFGVTGARTPDWLLEHTLEGSRFDVGPLLLSRALADATRSRIFEAISAKEETNCSELVSMRGVTPATVSHHLKVLQEAGLIQTRRQGLFVYSSTVPGVIEDYTSALARMVKRKSPTKKPSRNGPRGAHKQ